MQNIPVEDAVMPGSRLRALVPGVRVVSLLYLLGMLLIELIGWNSGLINSSVAYAVLIFIIVNHAYLSRDQGLQRLLTAIALLPLTRLLSVAFPVLKMPPFYQASGTAILILCSVFLAAHYLRISMYDLGLLFRIREVSSNRFSLTVRLLIQIVIALVGIPLGLLGGKVLQSAGLTGSFAVPLLPALLFSAAEELLYRGTLLKVGLESLSKLGILYSSLLFLVMNLASGSLMFALFMGIVGLLFAIVVWRTRLVWGVIFAHALLLVFLIV